MHPYKTLDEKAFWGPAVARRGALDIDELWAPKFLIPKNRSVVTFGSCFAQHISLALQERGFGWLNTEPAPRHLSPASARKFNYGVFSCRTGNIYTVSLLAQWVDWALGNTEVPDEIWENDGRYYDPFRPNIEPNGFASAKELLRSREIAVQAFAKAITSCRVFIFTLGLTESWVNARKGYEYPMCPGTVAGEYDPEIHRFENQKFQSISDTLTLTLKKIRRANPKISVLLTVSPVPLTATNSGDHVLVATVRSKSILRAVAAEIVANRKFVDYFPSYEIVTGIPFKGRFFESNLRHVTQAGVDHVMNRFFSVIEAKNATKSKWRKKFKKVVKPDQATAEDIVCEEEVLAAFADPIRPPKP